MNIRKEDGGDPKDSAAAEGVSTGRIPTVAGGASTCIGGDAGANGSVISESGAGASATALEAANQKRSKHAKQFGCTHTKHQDI